MEVAEWLASLTGSLSEPVLTGHQHGRADAGQRPADSPADDPRYDVGIVAGANHEAFTESIRLPSNISVEWYPFAPRNQMVH